MLVRAIRYNKLGIWWIHQSSCYLCFETKPGKQVAKFAWYHTLLYLMLVSGLMLAMPKS